MANTTKVEKMKELIAELKERRGDLCADASHLVTVRMDFFNRPTLWTPNSDCARCDGEVTPETYL
mgnify:CR=1 FL=1